MKIKLITKKLIDIFLNTNTSPTGWEPSCWLRLQKRGEVWVQIAGIRLPPWRYKLITENIATYKEGNLK